MNLMTAGDIRRDVATSRNDFPIFAAVGTPTRPLTYLDSAASAQKPACVIDREAEIYRRSYANAYRGVYRLGAEVDEALEASREAVRDFIGAASAEEIVFTSGTTMAINLVARGWGARHVQAGDEILVNRLEHHANLVPWQMLAEARSARLVWAPLTDDGRIDPEQFSQCLSSRTRIVALTAMSNVLGTMPPLQTLVERARQAGAVVLVDAAQSIAHGPMDVTALGIDFLAFSGHKLYGPSGIGVLYGRAARLDEMDPVFGGGHMIDQVTADGCTWAAPPARFEAGTPAIAQAIALQDAIRYVAAFGWDAIHQYEQNLLRLAHQRLADVPGVRLLGPAPEHKGAIASFVMQGAAAQDIALLLDRSGVCVRHGHHCAMPLHAWMQVPASVRASFAIYNSVDDVERLAEGLLFVRRRLRLD